MSLHLKILIVSFIFFLQIPLLNSQTTTKENNSKIIILDNEFSEFYQTDSGTMHQLLNNVKILHDSDTLYCDTALYFQSKNSVEAFGNVSIFQADGSAAYADYMRYTGKDKTVVMKANKGTAQLTDAEGNSLWAKEVFYNLDLKLGTYRNGGTLQSAFTLIKSSIGTYNLKSKEARFQKNVVVNDPEYEVVSEDLKYNTETKKVEFLKKSIVYSEGSIFQTEKGEYYSETKQGFFPSRSSIINENQYLEADTLYHNEADSNSWAKGNVIAIDTLEKTILYAGYTSYLGKLDEIKASEQPLLEILQEEGNSLFLKSDTFYVFSEARYAKDLTEQEKLDQEFENLETVQQKFVGENKEEGIWMGIGKFPSSLIPQQKEKKEMPMVEMQHLNEDMEALQIGESLAENYKEELTRNAFDSTGDVTDKEDTVHSTIENEEEWEIVTVKMVDSTEKVRKFIAYPHPFIFSDSLQAKADSMVYAQKDSMFTMYYNPVLWSNNQQITGKVIYIKMSQDAIEYFHVPELGILISNTIPEEAAFYNQMQAKDIKGFFEENDLVRVEAKGSAASIYYLQEEDDSYLGVSQATSDDIIVFLKDNEIDIIKYLGPTDQTMDPLHMANTEEKKLERFIWRAEEKMENWDAFFRNYRKPIQPKLFYWEVLEKERWKESNNQEETMSQSENKE